MKIIVAQHFLNLISVSKESENCHVFETYTIEVNLQVCLFYICSYC